MPSFQHFVGIEREGRKGGEAAKESRDCEWRNPVRVVFLDEPVSDADEKAAEEIAG